MNRKLFQIILPVLLCLIMVPALLAGCTSAENSVIYDISSLVRPLLGTSGSGYSLRALVLYSGNMNDGVWQDTLGYLEQSTLINLDVASADADSTYSLAGYDVVFPDSSVMESKNADAVAKNLTAYVAGGGSVFLENEFYEYFDADFIGAERFVPITECPVNITLPDLGDDLGELQSTIADFTNLYQSFADYPILAEQDYGYAVIADTAVPLGFWHEYGLYTMNRYGEGYVFFTNPLLPNRYCLSGYSMDKRRDEQTTFSNTAAGCNQLLLNQFISYVAKQRYGYSFERVFGSFGSPNMAWQLHYEEMLGMANDSLLIFSELCKEYLQVPSYSLVRSAYPWYVRAESVTYLLNQGGSGLNYRMDYDENNYSSGTHIAAAGKWLSLGEMEDSGSYFGDYQEYTYRAYPDFVDYNKDGVTDVFCGSFDGGFYYFKGTVFNERLCTEKAVSLTDRAGNILSVSGYSAPKLYDLNSDGFLDIVSGCEDGNIYWFSGNGTLAFQPEGMLIQTDLTGPSMPSVGDLNGDGVVDMAVGSNEAILLVYYGEETFGSKQPVFSHQNMTAYSGLCATAELGKWLAPTICDFNEDGISDLAVGTFQGYVALFPGNASGELKFDGYLTVEEMNYKGNHNIKFGNNCVPVFYDLDNDGKLDIAGGSLEYGTAYPLDSEYFPYKDKLQNQIDYVKNNFFYMGVHVYSNPYASSEREAYEIARHKEMFSAYGLDTGMVGANQHTWYTSRHQDSQTFLSEWQAGLLWNSGFAPSGANLGPQEAAESVVSLPFFLASEDKPTILIQNCSVLPYMGREWSDISAKYGVPISVYYHCDLVYKSDEDAHRFLQKVSDFQRDHGYNFVKEDQMMLATAAEYNMKLRVSGCNPSESGGLNLTLQAEGIAKDFPLFNRDYQQATGLRVNFSEAVNVNTVGTDADVWYRKDNNLYLGMNKEIRIYSSQDGEKEKNHLERINIPAKVEAGESGVAIDFLDEGMMQVVVSGDAAALEPGWTKTTQSGKTVFTKYGSKQTLTLSYSELNGGEQ